MLDAVSRAALMKIDESVFGTYPASKRTKSNVPAAPVF
jgi:hypothetical protein